MSCSSRRNSPPGKRGGIGAMTSFSTDPRRIRRFGLAGGGVFGLLGGLGFWGARAVPAGFFSSLPLRARRPGLLARKAGPRRFLFLSRSFVYGVPDCAGQVRTDIRRLDEGDPPDWPIVPRVYSFSGLLPGDHSFRTRHEILWKNRPSRQP